MKKLILVLALSLTSSVACAVSLPPTAANIEQAKATPADATNFIGNDAPSSQPSDTKPGDVVNYVDPVKGTWFQYGSSLSPSDAYNIYVNGGGGGE